MWDTCISALERCMRNAVVQNIFLAYFPTLSQSRVAVAEAGGSSGTQRKENVRRWKPLTSNGY
jgi:hypothetical protein